MNAFKTKVLVGLFVPALALVAGVASATGDTSKVTGQAATNGSTNTNDKSTNDKSTATTNDKSSASTNDKSTATTNSTTGMSSSKSSNDSGAFARLDTNHDGKLSAAEAAAD